MSEAHVEKGMWDCLQSKMLGNNSRLSSSHQNTEKVHSGICLENSGFWFISEYQPTWCAKFYNKFISSLYMFRAHVLIVRRAKIVLYSLWYQIAQIETGLEGILPVLSQSVHGTATYRCDDTRDCIIQFLPSWRWAHVLETCRGLK